MMPATSPASNSPPQGSAAGELEARQLAEAVELRRAIAQARRFLRAVTRSVSSMDLVRLRRLSGPGKAQDSPVAAVELLAGILNRNVR